MVELFGDALWFRFPGVDKDAHLTVRFHRTLRVPDDGKKYPLPPRLGFFPLSVVDDFPNKLPEAWLRHGGILFPMYQSEALWLEFEATGAAFAVKVAAGKINALTSQSWVNELNGSPQDYMAVPPQRWLDGYCVGNGVVRQFVAMPLGYGYTAEEQLTGMAEHGGLQIVVYPQKVKVEDQPRKIVPDKSDMRKILAESRRGMDKAVRSASRSAPPDSTHGSSSKPKVTESFCPASLKESFSEVRQMGLAPAGTIDEHIYTDENGLPSWDQTRRGRCFVHFTDSLTWKRITGKHPPTKPFSAQKYNAAGLPWFEYYDDRVALDGSEALSKLQSLGQMAKALKQKFLGGNQSIIPRQVVRLGRGARTRTVREGDGQ